MENFKTKLPNIKAFIFDVDGVITDGSVTLMPDGDHAKMMDIKDGYAMQLAVKKGFKVGIISGGRSEMIRKRMAWLGITDVYLGSHTKVDTYKEFIEIHDLKPEEILYMGDDIPDYEVMKRVGIAACPNDAAQEIKDISIYISHKTGGKGAVRDVIEQVLKVQSKWLDNEGFVW